MFQITIRPSSPHVEISFTRCCCCFDSLAFSRISRIILRCGPELVLPWSILVEFRNEPRFVFDWSIYWPFRIESNSTRIRSWNELDILDEPPAFEELKSATPTYFLQSIRLGLAYHSPDCFAIMWRSLSNPPATITSSRTKRRLVKGRQGQEIAYLSLFWLIANAFIHYMASKLQYKHIAASI